MLSGFELYPRWVPLAQGHAVVIVNDPFSDLPFFWQ